MEFKVENGDGIDSWKEVTPVYSAALRQMETKMQILNDEFQHVTPVQSHRTHQGTDQDPGKHCEKAQTLRAGIHHR